MELTRHKGLCFVKKKIYSLSNEQYKARKNQNFLYTEDISNFLSNDFSTFHWHKNIILEN